MDLPARDHLTDRLARQLLFIVEVDRLKSVIRRTLLTDQSRRENSAEHSWHLAVMASVLSEYAHRPVNLERVIRMILVHDIVEIDAGDTFAYDVEGHSDKDERERAAGKRLFGLLPKEQREEMWDLWREFEDGATVEARFANAMDRMQPMLHNVLTEGHTWRQHGVLKHQVLERNAVIEEGAPELWEYVVRFVEEAVENGLLSAADDG